MARRVVPVDDSGNKVAMTRKKKRGARGAASATPSKVLIVEASDADSGPLSAEELERVNAAVKRIHKMYQDTVGDMLEKGNRGMIEIGRFVFDTFYDGDPEKVAAHGRKSASLRALTQHPDMPVGKSQLNNMVRVAAQEKRLLDSGVKEIKQLSATHQIELLSAPDKQKRALVQQVVEQKLSVRDLQDRVAGLPKMLTAGGDDEAERTRIPRPLLGFLKLDLGRLANPDRLSKLPKRQLTKYRKSLEEAAGRIKALIKAIDGVGG